MNRLRQAPLALLACVVAMAACTPKFAPPGTGTPTPGSGGTDGTTKTVTVHPTASPSPNFRDNGELRDPNASPSPVPFNTPPGASTPTPLPSAGAGTPPPQVAVVPPREPLTGDDLVPDKAIVTGKVYDLDGNQMVHKGINVTFHSTTGFERKFDCDDPTAGGQGDGSYLSGNDFPPGTYTVTAVGYGYTPRTRTVVIDKRFKSTINFGTPGQDDACFGLSDFPEVSSVEFGSGNPNAVDGSNLHLVIHLSEPLSDDMKALFLADLRVLPVNDVASWVGKDQPDLTAQDPTTAKLVDFSYGITFPSDGAFYLNALSINWKADKDLTLDWSIPLLNGGTPGKYQIALVSGDPTQKVVDISTAKNQLGMDEADGHAAWPAANHFVNKVFRAPVIDPATFQADTAQHRWTSTHVNALPFTLIPDAKPPNTQGLTAEVTRAQPVPGQQGDPPETGTRLVVSFDKALIAFGPGGVVNQPSVTDLKNYSFAVGINPDYLTQAVHADGVSGVLSVPADTADFGIRETEQLGKEFVLTAPAASGAATVVINPVNDRAVIVGAPNPRLFYHDFVNDPCLKKTNVKAVKVRVGKLQDASGNAIQDLAANATAHQPAVAIQYHPPSATKCP